MNLLFKISFGLKQLFGQTLEADTSEMNFFEKLVSGLEDTVNDALGVNLTDMIIQIIATIVLVIIVKKFFWGRITEFLDQRQALMNAELSDAEKAREEAIALKETHDKELKDMRAKSKEYFESAKMRGDEEKKRIIDDAKSEAEAIIASGQKEVEFERQKAKEALKKEVVSIASLMTEKVIGEKVDEKTLLNAAIEDIEGSEDL
jgi:F-type H+-transporting ATPase subunit b